MAKKKIAAYIALDGEKEFRSAVTACNKSISTMKSEMKLVEAQTAGSANELDTLRKKHEVLSATLKEQVKKEEAVRTGLEHAEKEYARVGEELDVYKKKLQVASETLERMSNESGTTEEALTRQTDTVNALRKAVEKGEATYQRAGNRVQDWKKQLNNAEAQTIRTTKAVNENATYMKEAEQAIDGCAKSIDAFGKQTDDLADKITSTSKIIKENLVNTAVDAGKTLGKEIFESAVEGTLELQDAQNQLQASTGATANETRKYAEEMKSLYADGYGDSIDQTARAMALVKQYTNETDPTKIKELAENGMALEEVFDMDLSESIRGAEALIDNMGLSGQEAFDLIAKGAQSGLNKSGELVDNLAEYVPLWEQAGFSAKEMFTILQNGLDSGAYKLDTVNDYVKEFGNSLADGRIAENISEFSEETQMLFQKWSNGEATTKQVFQSVISDLSNMTDQQKALTIASNTWSSLGEDNAMKVITSLNNVNDTYENVYGTMNKVKEVKYDSVANQYKVLGRTFQTEVLQPILVKFLPPAQKGMKFLADHIDGVTRAATVAGVAVGTIFVVNKGKKFIKQTEEAAKTITDLGKTVLKFAGIRATETAAETASTTAKGAQTAATVTQTAATVTQTAATTEATVAQNGLNAAMAANPVGMVVAGITAVVGVAAILASNVEEAKDKTSELHEEAEQLSDEIQKSSEALKTATSEMATSMGEVEASGTLAKGLVEELDALASQSSQTTAEQARMKTIVAELNEMFPEMGLEIGKVSGKLNMSSAEMKKYIDTALQMQKIQVVQEKMKECVEELVDAEVKQTEAEMNLGNIEYELQNISKKRAQADEAAKKRSEEMRKAQNDYNEALSNGAENVQELYQKTLDQSEALIEYNGVTMSVSDALVKMSEDEQELILAKEEAEKSQKKINDAISEANEKMEPYTQYLTDINEATEENTQESKDNANAKAAASEQAQASIEIAGQETEAYNNLSAAQREMATSVTNSILEMQESVQGALQSQMDMFEKFDGGVEISTTELLSNMQSQVDGVTKWEENLSSLAEKGIDQGILQKLAEMGPEGAGYVTAFNSMTADEIAKANDLWKQSVDIKTMTNEWGQQLIESGATNIAGGLENLTPIMQASGANTVSGLVKGMQEAQKQAEEAGRDLGVETIESINEGLGCHSPSTKTKESGNNVNKGLINGMSKTKDDVKKEAKTVATGVTKAISSNLSKEKFRGYGKNVTDGLASGISSGEDKVVKAIKKVAKEAVKAAKDELEIHSPSHVFRGMGANTMSSFALGVQDEKQTAIESVSDALNFGDVEGKLAKGNATAQAEEYRMLKQIITEAAKEIKLKAYLNDREITRDLSRLGVVFNA